MPSLPTDTFSSLHSYVRSLPKHFDVLSEFPLTLNRSSSLIAVLIRIIDLPCYHKVFVQKERTWIISSSLIRIGIIAYYDSSLLGLRFTGFGLSFLDFMVNVECEKTASTTSILPMQVPENAIQMACYDLRPFYSVPEVARFKCIFTDLLENALF